MRVLFDACVLYPTVLRQILVGVCHAGLATPLWSPRILEEWARAAARLGPAQQELARGEIAALTAAWPEAAVRPTAETQATLSLPDPADIHVLAAAIDGRASLLVTSNLRDFPRRALAPFGIVAQHPDAWLMSIHDGEPQPVAEVVEAVRAEAERLSGQSQPHRSLLKRAGLPRLGKRLGGPKRSFPPG
jgi:predicted nucleic acid-binding protein